MAEPIYLDHAATTPVDPRVAELMTEVATEAYGNPSSRHALGLAAERRLAWARSTIAARVGVEPAALTFTSGGTEAIALAILGTARGRSRPGHVVISALEHPATLETCRLLEQMGHELTRVLPRPGHRARGGYVDAELIADQLRDDTFLVAVMHVNNETGIEQPVAEIGRVVAGREGCRFLVDAVQSFAKLPTDVSQIGADLMAISAHKIHGPKGVGCLVRRDGVQLAPLWGGGVQEDGLRPGTENVAGIAGFARAAELHAPDLEVLRGYTDRLVAAIVGAHSHAFPVGDPTRRAPHLAAVAVPRLRADRLAAALSERGVHVSTGSACHARLARRSEVTRSMGLGHGVLRVSVSRTTTADEIERAAEILRVTLAEAGASPGESARS